MTPSSFAVLIVNLGTPDSLTVSGIRRYLKAFLSDPRVIDIPRFAWWFILNGVILPLRSRRIVKNYKKIWWAEGSPLRVITQKQQQALAKALQQKLKTDIPVFFAMNYGEPSIAKAVDEIQGLGLQRVVVIPLFPQYSATTVASTFDAIAATLKQRVMIPELHFINGYHNHKAYINALAKSIMQHWSHHGHSKQLVFSFHGIPKRYQEKGDLYPDYCQQTAKLVAKALNLANDEWIMTFQSRIGPAEWLKPYTLETLQQLPAKGIDSVEVISPGFAADCLETLEELAILNRDAFIKAGGKEYYYIPALNDNEDHIALLSELVVERCQTWL